MSAEANLAGLYPPKTADIWNNQIEWQPIPIHTVPEKDDAVSTSFPSQHSIIITYYNFSYLRQKKVAHDMKLR